VVDALVDGPAQDFGPVRGELHGAEADPGNGPAGQFRGA
jgi:hypothetical protein